MPIGKMVKPAIKEINMFWKKQMITGIYIHALPKTHQAILP